MQSTHFDIIIIGGGAAGLAAAISAKRNNRNSKVAILELQSRVGKKLLATGNGRCNLTNMYISKSNYHGSFDICETLNKYSPEKLLEFFDGIGLVCSAENNGLVYPLCKQASAVLDILRLTTEKLGVTTICDCKVELVKKNKGVFNIRANTQNYSCNKVIVATGGKASPSCGGTGAGLDILRNLGHKITPLYPILRPIEVKCDYMKSLKGIRATGSVSLYDSDKKLISESGEIQFSENALSGICVFNLTPYLYNAKSPFILINLMDDYSENEIYNELKKRKKLFANEDTENYFTGLFHKRIGNALFRHCNISLTKRCSELDENEIKKLCRTIQNWKFECIKNNDFSKAQVMMGGVYGKEIDNKTFESKLIKNLYICGEAIDICGDCGGFNLHFAFSSGIIAGENI